MSQEDIRKNRQTLLMELDDQKRLVAHLEERDKQDKNAFGALAGIYAGEYAQIRADAVVIGHRREVLFSALEPRAAVERKLELYRAQQGLKELKERAAQLGITLA